MIEVTNSWDLICNMCILILENLSHITKCSYGFINVLFFVILGPLASFLFMASSIISIFNFNFKKKYLKIAAIILLIIGITIIMFIASLTLIAVLTAE